MVLRAHCHSTPFLNYLIGTHNLLPCDSREILVIAGLQRWVRILRLSEDTCAVRKERTGLEQARVCILGGMQI